MNTLWRLSLSLTASVLLLSCSSIEPKRVPDTAAQELETVGLRYYETRPFLVVRKPYPIASEPFLVQGLLSADGRSFYVHKAPEGLGLLPWTRLEVGKPLASRAGSEVDAFKGQGDPQTPADDKPAQEAPKNDSTCEKGKQSDTKSADGGTTETQEVDCEDTSGKRLAFTGISLETDLTGTALVPINELFSIIYLPDYDREFYIDSKARWGMSKLHITRGPGGTLLAYNSEVDNSAVVKPLFDAWNALVGAATKTAVLKIGPKAQGERVDSSQTSAVAPQGTPTTLRIHKVKFAVPGAYPFIKPKEVEKWKGAGPEAAKRMLIPSVAYQIPYDYFTVLVAEQLLDPAGDSALVSRVQDAVSSSGAGNSTTEGNQGSKNASTCPTAHHRPAASFGKVNANTILQKDANLRNLVTAVKVNREEPAGCAASLTITISDASKKDAVKSKLQESFSAAEFDVSE